MIRGYIIGGEQTIAKLGRLSRQGREAVRSSVQRLTLRLLAKVKSDKLTGQVLNVRTGRLRRSINQRVKTEPKGVYGLVGTNVEYARRHEYGGRVNVKAHTRMMRVAWGKKVRNPRKIQVRAHTVTYPERSFLRSALREMEPNIREELRKALIGGMTR